MKITASDYYFNVLDFPQDSLLGDYFVAITPKDSWDKTGFPEYDYPEEPLIEAYLDGLGMGRLQENMYESNDGLDQEAGHVVLERNGFIYNEKLTV